MMTRAWTVTKDERRAEVANVIERLWDHTINAFLARRGIAPQGSDGSLCDHYFLCHRHLSMSNANDNVSDWKAIMLRHLETATRLGVVPMAFELSLSSRRAQQDTEAPERQQERESGNNNNSSLNDDRAVDDDDSGSEGSTTSPQQSPTNAADAFLYVRLPFVRRLVALSLQQLLDLTARSITRLKAHGDPEGGKSGEDLERLVHLSLHSLQQLVKGRVQVLTDAVDVLLDLTTTSERRQYFPSGRLSAAWQFVGIALKNVDPLVVSVQRRSELLSVLTSIVVTVPTDRWHGAELPPSIHDSLPSHEDFYGPLQPVVRCASSWRECEHPDGCRYLCNAEYLVSGPRFLWVSLGSNNDFQWEVNVLRMLLVGMPTQERAPHAQHLIATFDCTLKVGKGSRRRSKGKPSRNWDPPEVLKSGGTYIVNGNNHSVLWAQSSICIGEPTQQDGAIVALPNGRRNAESDVFAGAATPAFVRLSDASAFLDAVLSLRKGSVPSQAGGAKVALFERMAQERVVLYPPSHGGVDISHGCGRRVVLKVDIERSEYVAIHQWLLESLTDKTGMGGEEGLCGGGATDVGMVQLELHRVAISKPFQFNDMTSPLWGRSHLFAKTLWWMTTLAMELSALGFTMVSKERNFFGRMCYEFVFVSDEYFVESELYFRRL